MKKDTRDRDELFDNIKSGKKALKKATDKTHVFYPFKQELRFLIHVPLVNTSGHVKKLRLLFKRAWKAYGEENVGVVNAQIDILDYITKAVEEKCKTPAYVATIKKTNQFLKDYEQTMNAAKKSDITPDEFFNNIQDLRKRAVNLESLIEKQQESLEKTLQFTSATTYSKEGTQTTIEASGLSEFLNVTKQQLKKHHHLMRSFLRTNRVSGFTKKVFDLQSLYLNASIIDKRNESGRYFIKEEDYQAVLHFKKAKINVEKDLYTDNSKPVKPISEKQTTAQYNNEK